MSTEIAALKIKGLALIAFFLLAAVIVTVTLLQDTQADTCTIAPTLGMTDDNSLWLYQSRWFERQIVYYGRWGECWGAATKRICDYVIDIDNSAGCVVMLPPTPTPIPIDAPPPTATPDYPTFISPVSPIYLPVIYGQV